MVPQLSHLHLPQRFPFRRGRFVALYALVSVLFCLQTISKGLVIAEAHAGCVITGIDESHAEEAHGMILSALRYIPSWKIFVYDLGLYFDTVQYLQKCAQVLAAPTTIPEWALQFERFNHGFKPWILEDFTSKVDCSLVMYADASIRFRQTFPKYVLSKQDVLDINLYFIHAPQRSWTHPDMYKWFSRSPSKCTLQQYQSGSILFRPTSPLWRQVFTLWRKCAQFKQCLLPDGAHIRGSNPNGSEYIAHRDDQSALNFALANVVGDEAFKNFGTLWSHIEAKREHRVSFRKRPKRAQC